MRIVIREITAPETYEIRKKELRKNMTLPEQVPGDFDSDTLHLGLFEDNRLACIATFMHTPNKNLGGEMYQLRGMATLESDQKKGYGKAILLKAEDYLKPKKVDIIWCNARVVALDFYKKCGYQIMGEEFDIPQIGGHYVMWKRI